MGSKVKKRTKKPIAVNHKVDSEIQSTIPRFYNLGAAGVATIAILVVSYFSFTNNNFDDNDTFQKWFVDNGGWMVPALKLEKTQDYGNILRMTKSGLDERISHKDRMIEIPLSIVFTREKASKKLEAIVSTQRYDEVLEVIKKHLSYNDLEQQDTWITIDLMLECSKGLKSRWYPYLQALPTLQQRLSSFDEKEYDFLQDDSLVNFGRNQRKAYVSMWNGGLQRILKEATNLSPEATSCITLDNFHNYVSLVASRAMILNHVSEHPIKYLTPMADMINHADSQQDRLDSSSNFHQYHRYQKESQSIVVFADRSFGVGDIIVEEYGKLDNSLYLTAFGFIPQNNPNHCVMLPLPYHGAEECVHRDGILRDDIESEKALVRHLLSPNLCDTKKECWSHPERKRSLQSYWRSAARTKLDQSPTTLENDEALMKDLQEISGRVEPSTSLWRGMNRDHARIALAFRIEEKKLLTHLAR